MNKKILKNIKFILIFICILFVLLFSIVSNHEYHLETCHDEDCVICCIINIAKSITKIFNVIILSLIMILLNNLIVTKVYKENSFLYRKTLVLQGVQKNE